MKKNKKAYSIISITCSILLIITSFICNYKLNTISFLSTLFIPFLFVINILFSLYGLFKKRKNSVFPILALLLYFQFFNSPIQLNASQENDEHNVFSFMTYNVRGFGSSRDIRNIENSKKIFDFIKSEAPDILCFQEFSRFEFNTFSYYPYRFVGYRSNYLKTLQVIYSNFPIVNRGYVDFPDTRNQTIFADVMIKNDIVRIYNIHLQSYMLRVSKSHGNLKGAKLIKYKIDVAQKRQEEQVQIVLDHSKSFKGKVIFTGDFNSTQYSKNYNKLKGNKTDSFVKSGFGIGATYPLFKYPFRIDYVLVDDGIEVLSHQNFDVKLSDHEPILTKLVIR